LSALGHFARVARLTTFLSGLLTVLCAVVVFGLEISSWVESGTWQSYTLSSAIDLLSNQDIIYVTASADRSRPNLTVWQSVREWLLSASLDGLLLTVVLLHLLFYLYITSIERALPAD
jgi:hypothetical protein